MRKALIFIEAWIDHWWFILRWNTSASYRRHVNEEFARSIAEDNAEKVALRSVVEAHDEAALAMGDEEFAGHQSDCAVCADSGRPIRQLT